MIYYEENGKKYIGLDSPFSTCTGCAFNDRGPCNNQCKMENYIFKEITSIIYEENGKKYIRVVNGESPQSWQTCSGCAFDTAGACSEQCEGHNFIFAVAPEEVEKTPEIYEPGHPHHNVWREYTESLLAGKPKQLEYSTKRPDDFWRDSDMSTSWHTDIEYQIKPESKLFWHMSGQKVVEYVERVAIQERSQLEIQIDGVKISSKSFTTVNEANSIAHKLGEIFETFKLKY